VASVMWKLKPDMITGNEAWILCGGTHHSVISFDLNAGHMRDFAEIMGMEFVHIGAHTNIPELREKLAMGDILWGR